MHVPARPIARDLQRVEVPVDGHGVPAEPGVWPLGERQLDLPGLPSDIGVLPRDRLGDLPLDRQAVCPEQRHHRRAHLRCKVGIGSGREPPVDREPFAEHGTAIGGRRGQRVDRRPRLLGVHVIGRERGDAAPIVDTRVEQPQALIGIGQVRRCLHAHGRTEHQPRDRDGRQELLVLRLRRAMHGRARLRAEVLHDDLLDVPVAPVEIADGEQRLGTLPRRLADADEDPGRERDRQATGILDRPQPDGGHLVGRCEVRATALRQPIR